MRQSSGEPALRVITAAYVQLATFAKTSYTVDGRGLIQLAVPALQPGTTIIVETHMMYYTLDHIRHLVAGLSAAQREDGDALVRLIEKYDPQRQAVVSVTVGRENPVRVTMDLERGTVRPERGVQ